MLYSLSGVREAAPVTLCNSTFFPQPRILSWLPVKMLNWSDFHSINQGCPTPKQLGASYPTGHTSRGKDPQTSWYMGRCFPLTPLHHTWTSKGPHPQCNTLLCLTCSSLWTSLWCCTARALWAATFPLGLGPAVEARERSGKVHTPLLPIAVAAPARGSGSWVGA